MTKSFFSDPKQSCWQLSVIQLSGWISLPILATSILILQQNSFIGSILTIVVGNSILWFIRLGVIGLSHEKRQSTLDLAREHFGLLGSYVISILLLVSTFVWFLIQTTAASNAINRLVSIHESSNINQLVQINVILGLASTLLCMQGMVLLRRFSTMVFPILCVTFLIVFYYLPHNPVGNSNHVSLSGLSLVLMTNLGITADMPTFFRHSRSWTESIKALTLTQLISIILGIAGLYWGSLISGLFEINQLNFVNDTHELFRYALLTFIFLSAITANVANVYSASVGWELIAPKSLIGKQEYLILGLGLTISYILLSSMFSPIFLLNLSDAALVNLSLVFVSIYIVSKQSPASVNQSAYLCAWAVSTILNAFQLGFGFWPSIPSILLSVSSIIITMCFFKWYDRSFRYKK